MRSSDLYGPSVDSRAGAITRGSTRLLRDLGFVALCEFKLTSRRRVDIAGLDKAGRFIMVEVKSSLADFRADSKWREYLPYADWFYFAVDPDFPRDVLPADTGLIVADAFQAAIVRPAVETPINGTRRRSQVLRFARVGADRVSHLIDRKE